ncbi:MAG: hypothetical protein ABFS14_04270 [Gemmatimonadota bacterium]
MTIYTSMPEGLPTWAAVALCAGLGLGVTACDVQWGGAQIALVDPAPETETAEEASVPPERVSLPGEPLLFAIGLAPGGARAVPVARLLDDGLADLGASAGGDETFWPRFEQTLQAAGTELGLYAGGARIGSLVIDSLIGSGAGECPAAMSVSLLLTPGSVAPQAAFAHAVRAEPGIQPVRTGQVDNRMRASGPVLAERLLTGAGENRPYLAQRTSMQAIAYGADQRDALVATYIVNDRLDGPAPRGEASSVFFLARFEPSRGYVPVWSEVRRYGQGSGKESFTFLESFAAGFGRVDVLVRRDGQSHRLAAGIARQGDRQVDWLDPGTCEPLRMIGLAPAEPVVQESTPAQTVPVQTTPVRPAPVRRAPEEAVPTPVEAAPVEGAPAEAAPAEAEADAEAEAEAGPVDTARAQPPVVRPAPASQDSGQRDPGQQAAPPNAVDTSGAGQPQL